MILFLNSTCLLFPPHISSPQLGILHCLGRPSLEKAWAGQGTQNSSHDSNVTLRNYFDNSGAAPHRYKHFILWLHPAGDLFTRPVFQTEAPFTSSPFQRVVETHYRPSMNWVDLLIKISLASSNNRGVLNKTPRVKCWLSLLERKTVKQERHPAEIKAKLTNDSISKTHHWG